MLGINSKKEPIRGKFVTQIRDTARRVCTGELNDADRNLKEEMDKRRRKYHAIWE